MAKLDVGLGLESVEDLMKKLGSDLPKVSKQAVYAGAGVVADSIRAEIEKLDHLEDYEKEGLLNGLGIAKIEENGATTDTKVGFDGYCKDHKTKSYPKGIPIPLLARSINSGTSWRTKQPFVTKAVKGCKDAAERAMAEVIDKKLKE